MPKIHRNNDARICGAKTVVQNQGSVFVNGELCSVEGSFNTHGAGGLIPTKHTVFVEGKPIIVHFADHSQPDNLCPIVGEPHCDPATAEGSPDVFAY